MILRFHTKETTKCRFFCIYVHLSRALASAHVPKQYVRTCEQCLWQRCIAYWILIRVFTVS